MTSRAGTDVGPAQHFPCPNPLCDKVFRSHDLVGSHISVPGSDCTKWTTEFLDYMLYRSPIIDEEPNNSDFDGMHYLSSWINR